MGETTESLTLNQLLPRLQASLPDLIVRYQIASLGVFGSYVRGEEQPDSDLDLLVEFREPPSLFGFIRLENELSALLGVKVDLVMKSALKPGIGRHILEEVQPV
jgi:predicted nucleotidyltransferase